MEVSLEQETMAAPAIDDADVSENSNAKRPREGLDAGSDVPLESSLPPAKKTCAEAEAEAGEAKGQKEEDVTMAPRIENDAEGDDGEEADGKASGNEDIRSEEEKLAGSDGGKGEVTLGPVLFTTSVQMFRYFYDLLHGWPLDFPVNKYEYLVLLDLIKQGYPDPSSKVGPGIIAFHVRIHPEFQSRCYYLIRNDGTMENFSYRKCVDKLLPLPSNMKSSSGEFDLDKIMPGEKGHKDGRKNFQNRGRHNNRGWRGRFGGRRGRGGRRN